MKRSLAVLGVAAAAATVLLGGPADAGASPGTVYFRIDGLDCAVMPGGRLGCDVPSNLTVVEHPAFLPTGSADDVMLPTSARQIVQDTPGGPMRSVTMPGTPYSLRGGNPPVRYEPNRCPGPQCSVYQTIQDTHVHCGSFHGSEFACYTDNRHGFAGPTNGRVRPF